MHVACGKCLQCRIGEAHICQHVKIIGVDANGAFAEYVVIPESNIWKLDPSIPQEYARSSTRWATRCTPCWPATSPPRAWPSPAAGRSGLFLHRRRARLRGHADLRTRGQRTSPQDREADGTRLRPRSDQGRRIPDRDGQYRRHRRRCCAGDGRPYRGDPNRLQDPAARRPHVAARHSRRRPVELNLAEEVIFKGATVQGINGRRMYQTWYQMTALLKAGKLDLHPVITDRIAMKDFAPLAPIRSPSLPIN
jgi:threonine 3-dehydrogenase